jgi:hypothetical protein
MTDVDKGIADQRVWRVVNIGPDMRCSGPRAKKPPGTFWYARR